MNWKNFTTILIIIGTIVGWIAWDAYVGATGATTESQTLRDWGQKFVSLPFSLGFLIGHWFWNRTTTFSAWVYAFPILAALLAWDITWNLMGKGGEWYRYPGAWALIGIPVGTLLWGQPA